MLSELLDSLDRGIMQWIIESHRCDQCQITLNQQAIPLPLKLVESVHQLIKLGPVEVSVGETDGFQSSWLLSITLILIWRCQTGPFNDALPDNLVKVLGSLLSPAIERL